MALQVRVRHTGPVPRKPSIPLPRDLRPRLEIARLDNLALMRALDRYHLADHFVAHPALQAFGQLDADCAEALAVLNRPPSFSIDWRAMVRDTEASLQALPAARDRLRALLDLDGRAQLLSAEPVIRDALDPAEAYNQVPGPKPKIR